MNGEPSLTGIRDYWTQEVFNLSAYNGIDDVRFRFAFMSNNDGSSTFLYRVDDGFYIDDLKVIKTIASASTLPVEFVKFYGTLKTDNRVALNWEAYVDQQHDHFEIERSADGMHYYTIGQAEKRPPYQFIDNSPKTGNNYYRIRQVDKDGTVSYSKTIVIVVENNFQVIIFPNPVRDQLTLNLFSKQAEVYKILITDSKGRSMNNTSTLIRDVGEVKINMHNWQSQLYILRVMNSKNEVVDIQKIMKL